MATSKPKGEAIRVSAIRISNVLGIQEIEIRPGALTLIEGRNGVGKTSILESIRACLGGGNDVTLLRQGAEAGEVVLELDNGVEITKQIGPEKSRVLVDHPDMGMISKPQTYLDKIIRAVALNPIDFLTARPDKRADILLDAIPMEVGPADLQSVLPIVSAAPNFRQHALKVIGAVAKDLYDQRTGVNRALKDKNTSVEQLRETLPPAPENAEDWKSRLGALRSEYGEHQTRLHQETADIRGRYQAESAALRTTAGEKAFAIQAEYGQRIEELQAQIERLKTERVERRHEIESALSIELQRVSRVQAETLEATHAAAQATTDELTRAIAHAEAMADQETRAAQLRDTIEQMETGASALAMDSDALTKALTVVDELKGRLLERLPIPGLEVRDSEIFLDGIPFERVNESRKVRMAIEIAKLRLGQLRIIIVDGLERLDARTFEAFAEEIRSNSHDVQFVLARVTDCDLTVRTAGEIA